MELLTAPTLLSLHGFPTRAGGVSSGPYASLNTSLVVGDVEGDVRANLERLAQAATAPIIAARQVHGDVVVRAAAVAPETEADGVWTSARGEAVGVRTADCLPVLLEDRRTGAVAAVHAGWRGVIAHIVERALEAMGSTERGQVFAAVGPCIQACCFEVDGDLPARFTAAFGAEVLVSGDAGQKPRLNLPLAVRQTLERSGVPVDHVAVLPQCTRCDPRFFSHRRDRGITGRHLSFITCGSASTL